MNNIACSIENLCVNYPQFQLEINQLELEKGYVYGLIGKNGSGKTTFLRSLMNLIPRKDGKISIYELELSKNEIELKNRIGYVNDDFVFPNQMTGAKLARQVGPFYKHFDDKLFEKYMSEFNVSMYVKFKELSKGSKTKVMIAFVLAYQPDLIILDEPTANLDPIARKEILEILYQMMEDENKTILFSTHITSDLDKIADYVLLIEEGHLVLNLGKNQIEEECQIVFMEEIDEDIRPYLKGIKKVEPGIEALCMKSSLFIDHPKYTFKRANIEDIMLYWELHHE